MISLDDVKFSKKDIKGHQNEDEKYLTEGEGSYTLEILNAKDGQTKDGTATYHTLRFRVDDASHDSHYSAGDVVTHVIIVPHARTNRQRPFKIKELLSLISSAAGAEKAYKVPDGKHAGKVVGLVDQEDITNFFANGGENVTGNKLKASVTPGKNPKYLNVYFDVLGQPLTWAELEENDVDMYAKVTRQLGA